MTRDLVKGLAEVAENGEHGTAAGGAVPERRDSSPGVVATPWDGDDWALVVGSGSDLAELYDGIAGLPTGLAFVEAFGDVDLVLVYRPAGTASTSAGPLDALVDQAVRHGGTLVGSGGPNGLSTGEQYRTSAERAAFAAGQADALGRMRRALTGEADARPNGHGVPIAS
ncbi:hypothetical protein FraEuI1c_0017 [Pseudofrankia inefficax]|uniref:Uncharacterized protein n=2 Tax=Pseudofrankia inefficax (strain DSM 45817 / CECT 9037 / DDB 130130 / EuI1c) TaxID=298654 RepID=E3J267_PSEI1|nr:hypothetical protein FraEuI1c_0017 [Pseudofrankia inefficax]